MTELEASGVGDAPPPYMIFVVVFLFFITGLLGFLICHLLKKKGYRCRTGDMDDEEEEEEKLGGNADDDDEENQDTVEQILKCIIENEANMEAFNEMLGNHNVCVRHDPRLRKESIGGIPPHHHTVHSGTDHNSCHLCAQVRSKKGRRQSRTPRPKQRPGEQTVFSVGRFRVIHTDKKLQGGPNPLVGSGDQLDQSQDSEERKDVGYNLRSMFKDVRPPSESSNGTAVNVGKRRKSLTIFGLRRGSDPAGIKVVEGTGRETGGVRFAIQQQPVVLEEPLLTKASSESDTKPGPKLEIKTTKCESPASPQYVANISSTVNCPTSKTDKEAHDSSSVSKDGSKHDPSPEPCTSIPIKPSDGSTAASVPSTLPILPSASSGKTFKRTEKQEDVEDNVLRNEETYDPGPLQTSTPIAPGPGSIPGLTPVISSSQPEPILGKGLLVTQTPSEPSFSPDLEPGFGASLALISLGSSPPSSLPIKTLSSVSSLKTPTSPFTVTPSPKLSSRDTPSEAAKTAFTPALIPSPKLPSGRAMSSQSPIPSSSLGKSASPLQAQSPSPALTASPKPDSMPVSPQSPSSSSPADQAPSFESSPRLSVKSGSAMSVTSRTFTKDDMVSNPLSLMEQGARIPNSEEKTEIIRVGILKREEISPLAGDFKGSALSFPSEHSKDKLGSLPLLASSSGSPSSPLGNRINSVTIVKASPDSKREFSVVTMVEKEEQSTSQKSQTGETSKFGVESEKVGASTLDQGGHIPISGVGQHETQIRETSGEEVRSMVSQEKDDMVEMEDIRDCKVTQVEEAERVEEVEKMVNFQSKAD
ncbi:hypothetical protein PAMP_022917 [Pampus punctatissimus]